MRGPFTPGEDITHLMNRLDKQWEDIDRISVPREVRSHVEHHVPGEKLTADAAEVIIDFLREVMGVVDDISDDAEEIYVVAERLSGHLNKLEEDAEEAREQLEAERQRAADMDTDSTRGGSAPPLHHSGRVVAAHALKDTNMEEKKKLTSPSKIELLGLATSGVTITSKKTAASDDMPWVHGRVINGLVSEGLLIVLAEAAHEKEIETTEAGRAWLDHQLNTLSKPPTVEDEDDTPEESEPVEEIEDEEDDLEFADEEDEDFSEDEEGEPYGTVLKPAGRVLVFVTEENGQISADIDVQAITDMLIKAINR